MEESLAIWDFVLDEEDMEQGWTRPISEGAYEAVTGPKELCIVPEASHVNLYDDVDKIPFDRLEEFFKENLKEG